MSDRKSEYLLKINIKKNKRSKEGTVQIYKGADVTQLVWNIPGYTISRERPENVYLFVYFV